MSPRLRLAAFAALARRRASLVPFMFGSFRVGQFTQVLAYAVAMLGLNLLVGYSGQISLGQGAFFAHRRLHRGDPDRRPRLAAPADRAGRRRVRLAWPGCSSACRRCGVRGLYLALLTLGLAVATPPVIKRLESLPAARRA